MQSVQKVDFLLPDLILPEKIQEFADILRKMDPFSLKPGISYNKQQDYGYTVCLEDQGRMYNPASPAYRPPLHLTEEEFQAVVRHFEPLSDRQARTITVKLAIAQRCLENAKDYKREEIRFKAQSHQPS